ncbi:MAG: hypothetical protein KDC35_04635 [Acidobacteria bacterium]|nr:hypothetical protein [Acidobacteriota bacterium]
MIRDLFLLWRLSLVQVKNRLVEMQQRHPVILIAIVAVGGFFYWGYIKLSGLLIGFIFQQDVFGVILLTKLIQIMMIIAIGVAVMSALTTAIATFYMSQDLEFQFCLPVNFDSWVFHRYGQVYIQSCWMILAFGSPIIWEFLRLSEVPLGVQMISILAFMMICSIPVFASTALSMLLVRVFPARRMHQVLLVFTLVLMSFLVFLFRYLEPEQFVGPGGIDRFRGYMDLVNVNRQTWNPAIWAADFITALSQKEWMQSLPNAARMVALVSAIHAALALVARRFYKPSWDRALQALSGEVHGRTNQVNESRLSKLLGSRRWHHVGRELLVLFRDPSQWSQIFVLISLLALYLFSITKLPLTPFGGTRYQLALGNTAFVGFVALSIASRFVFTSFSVEGPAVWILKTSPERWRSWIIAKTLVYGLPTVLFSMALTVGSAFLLEQEGHRLLLLVGAAFWDGLVIVGIALALGLVFMNPYIENPLKMMVSPGGFMLMATGLIVVALHVMLRLTHESEFMNYLMHRVGWPNVQGIRGYMWGAGLAVAETTGIVMLMKRGLKSLRAGEFL